MFCFTTSGFSLKNFKSIIVLLFLRNLPLLFVNFWFCRTANLCLTFFLITQKAFRPVCHPAHGTKGYKSLFRVATHLVTAAFLSKAFCGNPFAMTSRFVCYGIRPRDFHHWLRKWKGIFLYRFSPSTDSLKHSCCRSFHHCQFLTLLYTHYFRNASLIYPDQGFRF